jgi:hypothetical protein
MSGAILQLTSYDISNNHINNNRHSIENRTLSFNNNTCIIEHIGDLYLPTKIVCYNCDNNFNINNIKLVIGGNDILKIECEIMNNIIDFIEDINFNGNICKIYHLDKTKLFFNIKILCLVYSNVTIIINNSGNCNNINLMGKYTFLESNERDQMIHNTQTDIIKQFRYGKFNYTQGTQLATSIQGNINGFILSNLNVDNIKSIKIKLNSLDRINYNDNIEILLNTYRINNSAIYINLNDSHYMDLPTNSSLNCCRIYNISFIIESEDENIDLHISVYSDDTFIYLNGISTLRFNYNEIINTIHVNSFQQVNSFQRENIVKFLIKPIEGNTICPVLQEEITNKYIFCDVCKYNFDYTVYDNWVKSHNNCPHCRSEWIDYTIYQIIVDLE